jgi:hypothetical protein
VDRPPEVAIAVLFERIGSLAEKIDALSTRIEAAHRSDLERIREVETRLEVVEDKLLASRWFVAGLAAGGGLLGGTASTVLLQIVGN